MPIRIRSKKDGFRRCGIAHPAEATIYPDKKFSKKELEMLDQEPMLIMDYVDPEEEDMTVAQLTEELTALQVDIPAKAKKADLIELLKAEREKAKE